MDTKLHTAVRYGDEEAVLSALKLGLNPNQVGLLKWSPVHEAAHSGEREILKLLLRYKGDVDLQDNLHRNTALHYAAKEDNSACVTVLLKAGARVDIKNKDGLTCIDVATAFCKDIIQDYVNQQGHPGEWRDDLNNNPGGKTGGGPATDSWGDLPRVPDTAAIGHLHLSFEYHKTNLKIRVWQVSDLLLPPPQISMIESIFVRSYLIPDAVKKTNRKTEDVRVESSSKKELQRNTSQQSGIQHIFTPSSFKFEAPLLYTGVTKPIVEERSVRLEVCMTQKHTHRAFLMAIVHMPLAVAVRRPIRERYPLIPCMNYTIPNNMRVYSARDIILENAGGRQEPGSLSRSNSSTSSTLDGTSSTASQKFVSLNLSDSDDDEAEVAGILEIKAYSPSRKAVSSSPLSSSITIPEDADTNALTEVVMGNVESPSENVSVDMSEQGHKPKIKKKIIPNEILSRKHKSEDSDTEESEDSESLKVSVGKGSHSPSAVVDIGQHQGDAVVDIDKLQGDVVIDVGSDNSGGGHPSITRTDSVKKKIIPPSELLSKTARKLSEQANADKNSAPEECQNLTSESGCVYDDIASHSGNDGHGLKSSEDDSGLVNLTEQKDKEEDDQSREKADGVLGSADNNSDALTVKDVTEMSSLRISSRVRSGSEVSSEVGSTTTSRPETPVWDFYDFADEEGGGEDTGPAGGQSGGDASGNNAVGDEASKALGTLQESILRLSRSTRLGAAGNSGVLETERVDGPVLPTVMIEDFEEMEEALGGGEEPEEDETEQVETKKNGQGDLRSAAVSEERRAVEDTESKSQDS